MNTLYIHDGSVDLIGFDSLKDNAYFIFRNSGLAISKNEMDINNEQHSYKIKNKSITDEELYHKLLNYGFSNAHTFSQDKNGVYYSLYPVLEK